MQQVLQGPMVVLEKASSPHSWFSVIFINHDIVLHRSSHGFIPKHVKIVFLRDWKGIILNIKQFYSYIDLYTYDLYAEYLLS